MEKDLDKDQFVPGENPPTEEDQAAVREEVENQEESSSHEQTPENE